MRINGRIFSAAILTGLFTGLFVASAEELFSRDGTLGGIEALVTFIPLPLLAALFVSIGLRQRRITRRMVSVAYLTLLLPLLGIGMGGANVFQQMIGGVIGGFFWGLLFAINSKKSVKEI